MLIDCSLLPDALSSSGSISIDFLGKGALLGVPSWDSGACCSPWNPCASTEAPWSPS